MGTTMFLTGNYVVLLGAFFSIPSLVTFRP